MAPKIVSYYLLRVIRICVDIFTDCIGLIYPSKKNYLPPLTDPLLLEPVITLAKRIKTGQVLLFLSNCYF